MLKSFLKDRLDLILLRKLVLLEHLAVPINKQNKTRPGQGEVEGKDQSSREEADKVETPSKSFWPDRIIPSCNKQHN